MRLEKSVKNISFSFITNIIKLIILFFMRRIFLFRLGEEYLGLNGVLLNLIAMFSLVELGIGSAIGYSLYKPLSEENFKNIASKMNFFRLAYKRISLIILIVGIGVYPFIQEVFKKNQTIEPNTIKLAYFLFVIDTVISYLFSYKKILLEADQKTYKINIINIIFFILTSLFQCIMLIKYNNFIFYIVVKIIFNFINNFTCSLFVDKEYKYLKKYNKLKINKEERKNIFINTKALILHKIGDICINATDNIIIAKYINISMVGLFSNYMMIILAAQGIIAQIFSSLMATIGSMIVKEDKNKAYEIFKVLNFIGFLIFGLMTVVFYNSIQIFIEVWLGKEYIIDGAFLVIISLNMYITGMRIVTGTVKSAAGYYVQDKYSPLIQSIFNLYFSIYLVKEYGIIGVLIGTLISSLIPTLYRPYILYKYLFERNFFLYFKDYFKYLLNVILLIFLSVIIIDYFRTENILFDLGSRIILSSIIFLTLALLLNLKTKEFEYIKENIIKKLGGKIWKKKFQ